jgi:oligopeptide transport system permease protein
VIWFAKRLLGTIPTLLVISFFAFVLVRIAPGGPFDKERRVTSAEVERQLKAKYHLDEPVWRQYMRYLSALVRGDLGPSLKQRNHSVNDILAQGLPISLTLGGLSFFFALALGLPLGLCSAVWRGKPIDHAVSFLTVLLFCIPPLVAGPILIMIFSIKLRWLPVALWDGPAHVVLPMLTLGMYFSGRIARLFREGLREILNAPFVTAARAKGLSESAILWRHILPLAILPVLSYSGPLLADLLTGSFVVENIFQLPGIGLFLVNGSLSRDYPLIVGLVLLYAVILLFLNVFVDAAYSFLDPRVRLS